MRIPSLSILAAALVIAAGGAPLAAQTAKTAVKAWNFPGRYNNKAAQGMAVFGDTAFLCNDTGYCRIYDLKTSKKLAEFELASASDSNHANCVSFGVEFPKGNKMFPAFYVSECWQPYRCFVESITESGPKLVQTLFFKTGAGDDRVFDWVVDRGGKCIYALGLQPGTRDAPQRVVITKLPLPPLPPKGKTSVTLTKSDILDQFSVSFGNLTQGATVRGDYLYMPVGNHDGADGSDALKSRAIKVINLKTKQLERSIDLNASVPEEPEDADFHGDTLLLYCGQRGGLYKVNTK